MQRIASTRNITLTISAIAGLAISAPALLAWEASTQAGSAQNLQGSRSAQQSQQGTYLFQSADELLGKSLKNPQGEELATIDDMIIDRGTGKIEAIVIREGGFLGFGGTHVAIPYKAFSVDSDSVTLTLNAATDMLDDEDKTVPSNWQRLEDDWDENLDELVISERALMQKLPAVGPDTKTQTVQGTITEIKRVDLGETRHWLAVRVDQNQGNNPDRQQDRQRNGMQDASGTWVVLGPSWYALGGTGAPIRGEKIQIEAFQGYGDMMHAKRATFDGDEIEYRNDKLEPMWTNRVMRSESVRNRPSPFVLLTDVMDRSVVRGGSDDDIGEVEDAIIELSGGYVAMLSIDTDGDWWGENQADRAVPFDVARIGEDAITIDATQAMLRLSAETPKDIKALTDRRARDNVFVIFEVSEPVYLYQR